VGISTISGRAPLDAGRRVAGGITDGSDQWSPHPRRGV